MVEIFFQKDFDYRASDFVTIAYSAGTLVEVEEDCAAQAVAKGAAQYADFAEDDLMEGRIGDHEED